MESYLDLVREKLYCKKSNKINNRQNANANFQKSVQENGGSMVNSSKSNETGSPNISCLAGEKITKNTNKISSKLKTSGGGKSEHLNKSSKCIQSNDEKKLLKLCSSKNNKKKSGASKTTESTLNVISSSNVELAVESSNAKRHNKIQSHSSDTGNSKKLLKKKRSESSDDSSHLNRPLKKKKSERSKSIKGSIKNTVKALQNVNKNLSIVKVKKPKNKTESDKLDAYDFDEYFPKETHFPTKDDREALIKRTKPKKKKKKKCNNDWVCEYVEAVSDKNNFHDYEDFGTDEEYDSENHEDPENEENQTDSFFIRNNSNSTEVSSHNESDASVEFMSKIEQNKCNNDDDNKVQSNSVPPSGKNFEDYFKLFDTSQNSEFSDVDRTFMSSYEIQNMVNTNDVYPEEAEEEGSAKDEEYTEKQPYTKGETTVINGFSESSTNILQETSYGYGDNSLINSSNDITNFQDSQEQNIEYDQNNVCWESSSILQNEISPRKNKIAVDNSCLQCFDSGNNKVCILNPSSMVYAHGLANVKVLYGQLEILGYTLNKNTKRIKFYSPRGSALLYLNNSSETSKSSLKLSEILPEYECLHDVVIDTNTCVFECSKLEEPNIKFLEKHVAQQIFPQADNNEQPRIVFDITGSWNSLKIGKDWNRILQNFDFSSRAILVGSKGVGKSTFIRYAINTLLQKYPRVRVVDVDPGQSEFSPPGMISIVEVDQPVFGPNYTHLRRPIYSQLANINTVHNPYQYIEAVRSLGLSLSTLESMPTLINYMGFITYLGIDMLYSCIAALKPNLLLQITSKKTNRNFRGIFFPTVFEKHCTLVEADTSDFKYECIVMDSMAEKSEAWSLEPRQSREMCILSYFGQMLSKEVCSIVSCQLDMYSIGLADITITNLDGTVLSSLAANANLVALCHKEREKPVTFTCYGYGIVRGIDPDSKALYLLTPETAEILENVFYLVMGSVTLPPSILMTTDGTTGLIPYINSGELISFGQLTKRTYIPANKR